MFRLFAMRSHRLNFVKNPPLLRQRRELNILFGRNTEQAAGLLIHNLYPKILPSTAPNQGYCEYINEQEISVIHRSDNFESSEIRALAYDKMRVIIGHGMINHSHAANFHEISLMKSAPIIRTADVLSQFKDKQEILFVLSCYSGAIHSDNHLDDILGNSILVTCIDDRFSISQCAGREIAFYVSELSRLNIDPKIIALAVISRFPFTITIKMPDKESAAFGNTLQQYDEHMVKNTIQDAIEYLELNSQGIYLVEKLIDANFSRYQELDLFEGFINWERLDAQEKDTLVQRYMKTPASLLNRMQSIDGDSLIGVILSTDSIDINTRIELANAWIAAGCDLNIKGYHIASILIIAMAYTVNIDLIKRMIDAGANPLDTLLDNFTLLHTVITFIDDAQEANEMFQWLLRYNFDLHIIRDDGTTLLDHAITSKKFAIADFLLEEKGLSKSTSDFNIYDAYNAARGGHVATLKHLIQRQVPINEIAYGNTCLHVSTQYPEIVKLLIDAGADVNVAGDGLSLSWTPLHIAVKHAHLDALEILIANDANINAQDDNGMTPLHIAAKSGNLQVVQALITHGALTDIKDDKGNHPLQYALKSFDGKYFDLLTQLLTPGTSTYKFWSSFL